MDASALPDFGVLSYPTQRGESGDFETSPLENSISLNTSSSWTYCGPLLTLDTNRLPSSFHTWAEATVNGPFMGPLLSFLAFVHKFLKANNLSNYWLTIRASTGSGEFDVPRWHADDLFFSPAPETRSRQRRSLLSPLYSRDRTSQRPDSTFRQKKHLKSTEKVQVISATPNPTNWKLTTTLLGPGTLFITPKKSPSARAIQRNAKRSVRAANPHHICLSVRCVGCAMAAESVRTHLAAELGQHGIVQARSGECVFFRVGEDEGAVHSEPMSHGDRIFVNIVPGHEADLKCLMAKWGMEYPRAWCVGLPFQGFEERSWRDIGDL
ncbi:hypothetical protein N7448_000280 [Penicillium atrosanguineum]|nr:hypothetical protein N7448_000280 [Penicillium atrosanguineum]